MNEKAPSPVAQRDELCASALWSAVTSEAIHRIGFGVSEHSSLPSPRLFPIESGDCADSVAAVQNLPVSFEGP